MLASHAAESVIRAIAGPPASIERDAIPILAALAFNPKAQLIQSFNVLGQNPLAPLLPR
jgi:hypothetical protein